MTRQQLGASMQRHRARVLAVKGALLGLGSPAGWLLYQWTAGVDPAQTLANQASLIIYLLASSTVVFGLFGWTIGAQEDRLIALNRELDRLTITDALTGLSNRRYFTRRLDEAIAQGVRLGAPIALAMVDLDHFKRVNDRFGHGVGDSVLCGAAEAMARVVRRGEILARIGGEEFCVLMPGVDESAAIRAGERLREAVRDGTTLLVDRTEVSVSASVGVVALVPGKATRAADLLSMADAAMYSAKRAGRDRVEVFATQHRRRFCAA